MYQKRNCHFIFVYFDLKKEYFKNSDDQQFYQY